ncbi:unnamed protein product, partial [Hapterophycus canaliculatus]
SVEGTPLVLLTLPLKSRRKTADLNRRRNGASAVDACLQVLLISDPETDKEAAAIDVRVGSSSDPPYLQGTAHFCEHMLFLGTGKRPEEWWWRWC